MFFKKKRQYFLGTGSMWRLSAGIKVTFLLADWLNRHGYKCYCNLDMNDKRFKTPKIADYFTGEKFFDMIDNGGMVAILPEVLEGNVMRSKHVARYVLGAPVMVQGNYKFPMNEHIFVYQDYLRRWIAPQNASKAHELFINPIEMDLFWDERLPRTLKTCYVGKAPLFGEFEEKEFTKRMVHITRDFPMFYPKTRWELADILKRSKALYTYDSNTAILTEAKLCGCPVVIIEDERQKATPKFDRPGFQLGVCYDEKDMERARSELGDFKRFYEGEIKKTKKQLWRFVEITQNAV